MQVEIIRLDDNARGIGYIDGKIVFVPKTLPGDIVEIEITLNKKKYSEGKVIKYIKNNEFKIENICPYFQKCGGCQYLNLEYDKSLEYKINNLKNNFIRAGFNQNILINQNDVSLNYRNKISLKIINSKIGFYEKSTNDLVEIDNCQMASNNINKYILEIKKLNLKNANVTIRCNYKNEILLIFNTKEKIDVNLINLEDCIGIIHNNLVIYGTKYITEKINNLDFEITYNSFFQINPYITEKIINHIQKEFNKDDIVLDLYCGTGLLGLSIAKNVKKVIGLEVVKNAVINAKNNALINNIENASFLVGDLSKDFKIKDKITTVIVDPPRNGLDKILKDKLRILLPEKIIYISCNPVTLIRDLKELRDLYDFNYVSCYDMFSYTSHVECVVILCRK